MANTATPAETVKTKNPARIILIAVRVLVVYLLVSLYVGALNFFNIITTEGATSFVQGGSSSMINVFSGMGEYRDAIRTYIYDWANGIYAGGIIIYAALIIIVIAALVTLCDGKVKKIAALVMTCGFAVSLVGLGIIYYACSQANDAAASAPMYVAMAIYAAGFIASLVSIFAPGSKQMFDKNVSTDYIGGKITTYFAGSFAEMKKVVWPSRSQVINNTIVVLLCILLVGAIIWILDLGLGLLGGVIFKS